MTPAANYPSPKPAHRRIDLAVHLVGLLLIVVAGVVLLRRGAALGEGALLGALAVYVLCALASNLASIAYHFAPWHARRVLLRRIDHAAIYPSISGTFTPFFVQAGTPWTLTLLVVCWALTLIAMWKKITGEAVQSRGSTASYLGLGAIGLSALPDMTGVPVQALWCILAGAAAYVVGTVFYTRRQMPFRYSIWHTWVNIGGLCMFAGIWISLP